MPTPQREDAQPLVNVEPRPSTANSSVSERSRDDEAVSESPTASVDGAPESDGDSLATASAFGCNQPLFVPELTSTDQPRLTVEDIYIEAMTLDAEIRVFKRRLNSAGRKELSRIINFCRDALHRKLLLRSVEAQEGLGTSSTSRRSVSSENLVTPTHSKPLALIAETAV